MRRWMTVARSRAALMLGVPRFRIRSAMPRLRTRSAMPPLARPLRIAQIAPLAEAVPPRLYGGTERVVAHLTDALVAAGHDVTLFASGDARTAARHAPMRERAIRLDP